LADKTAVRLGFEKDTCFSSGLFQSQRTKREAREVFFLGELSGLRVEKMTKQGFTMNIVKAMFL
jgi:hypothetical protein